MKTKDWWVFEKDGKFVAVEDKHDGRVGVLKGYTLVGIVAEPKPSDAIDYVTYIEANKPMRRKKV